MATMKESYRICMRTYLELSLIHILIYSKTLAEHEKAVSENKWY